MSGTTYYERNRDVILNRAKDYYENNKELLRERAKNKYKELPENVRNNLWSINLGMGWDFLKIVKINVRVVIK